MRAVEFGDAEPDQDDYCGDVGAEGDLCDAVPCPVVCGTTRRVGGHTSEPMRPPTWDCGPRSRCDTASTWKGHRLGSCPRPTSSKDGTMTTEIPDPVNDWTSDF